MPPSISPLVPSVIHLPALSPPQSSLSSRPHQTYHIIFITGNPGLISYYSLFLTTLSASLSTNPTLTRSNISVSIYGKSLRGFETDELGPSTPSSLERQINFMRETIDSYIANLAPTTTTGNGKQPEKLKIILIGHSVGAYIALSLLSQHLSSPDSSTSTSTSTSFDIIGGILLFPTVTHIATSPSGRRLSLLLNSPPWLSNFFVGLIAGTAQLLAAVLGRRRLTALVRLITGMSAEAAGVTAGFLGSAGGVRQALHMGRDELLTITADKWDDRVWGSAPTASSTHASRSPLKPAKLFFYFGQNDHWVAEKTRDDLIASRAFRGVSGEEWKPRMEIDRMGVPHGFCIHHSELIALKCRDYIEQIVQADKGRDRQS